MILTDRDIRPLTRHCLAWFPQWRRADPTERERLRKRCLSSGFAETLERLEANIAAYRGGVVAGEGGPLEILLAGLAVPEPGRVITDLARAVYPESDDCGKDLLKFEALRARLEKHFEVPEPRAKPQPANGARPPTWIKPAEPEKETEMVATPTADPTPERALTPRQAEILKALMARGCDPARLVPVATQQEIAKELKTTSGAVSFHLSGLRDRLGIAAFADEKAETGARPPETPPQPGETPQEPALAVGGASVQPEPEPGTGGREAAEIERLRAEVERLERVDERHLKEMHRAEERHYQEARRLREEVAELTDRVTILSAANESLLAEIRPLRAQASALPSDRALEPVAQSQELAGVVVPSEERLTEGQRMTAFRLLGDCPGTLGDRRRVLTLAADLAAVAESR